MSPRQVVATFLCLVWLGTSIPVHGAEPAPIPGIKNLRQVTPAILCGSQPESAESFEALAQHLGCLAVDSRGCKTEHPQSVVLRQSLRHLHPLLSRF